MLISSDTFHILAARAVRAFADGYVALLLPIYLIGLGFDAFAVGAIAGSTLIGTALLTLWVGFAANRHSRRRLLLGGACLMTATGASFTLTDQFWPLLIIAFVGTINPTAGDASVFRPLEQTILSEAVEPRQRTAIFARYSLVGTIAGALGILAAAIPDLTSAYTGWDRSTAIQFMFAAYGLFGAITAWLYFPLSPAVEAASNAPVAPLGQSRRLVYGLAALFGMDSLGSGFLVQSLLTLWLYQTFQISVPTAAAILFWSNVCSAVSYLIAVPIAKRIGLINTMVFTHFPSNILLILLPFSPDLPTAIGLLLARSALSQMDVPTRTSYVMAIVTPEERPAAASLTSVPKTFAWAAGSIVSGYLLTVSSFGWPLLIGGVIKGVYDILLLIKFRSVRPPEEL